MHPSPVFRAAVDLQEGIWWRMRMPGPRKTVLADIIQEDAPCDDTSVSARNMGLIAERHHTRLLQELANGFKVAPGYKRTRGGRQVLELRFDGVAGCLRTPEGGSSRQLVVLRKTDGKLATRLLTVRETARLMGAPDKYKIPGSYNDGYKAMGDAVAVPVVRHLAAHLLLPIAEACGAFLA
jgi:DNA (cytosine-5)-methyltransferase 1